MRFEKWQGLGNDFVIVEEEVAIDRVRALCDRRCGIGADGVIHVEREGEALRMVVRNADGSRPEMCGNGLRCVVGWAANRDDLDRGELVVVTDAGQRRCAFDRHGAGYSVGAGMGRAQVGEPYHFEAGGVERRFVPVDVGNPHAVTFEHASEADLEAVGPALERHVAGGVNVELCEVEGPQRLRVRVWERGVGATRACGTGACAVVAAAAARGLAPFEAPVEVTLPGGRLSITVSGDMGLHMRGPASRVFVGEVT